MNLEFISYPSHEDWEKNDKIAKILKALYEAIKMISRTDYITSNKFLAVIRRIKEVLISHEDDDAKYLRDMIVKMKDKFDKYGKECNLVISITAILDPRFKMKMIKFTFSTLYSKEECSQNIFQVRNKLKIY